MRRTPSDLFLWLFTILPACAILSAVLHFQAISVLGLVFGFSLMEAGRLPDVKLSHAAARYSSCAVIATVLYVVIGYQLMFGSSPFASPTPSKQDSGLLTVFGDNGTDTSDYASIEWTGLSRWERLRFQSLMCITAVFMLAAGMSRAVTLRMQLSLCALLAGAVYPLFGHSIWDGGWLSELGFRDFAGGLVVYGLAGWAALGTLTAQGRSEALNAVDGFAPNERPGIYIAGASILWFAVAGLGLVELTQSTTLSETFIAMNMAFAAGAVAAMASAGLLFRAWRVQFAVVGGIAALAGLTAIPLGVTPGWLRQSLLVGGGAGGLAVIALKCLDNLSVRDVLGMATACAVGGSWGALYVALANVPFDPVVGNATLFPQLVGITTAIGIGFGMFCPLAWLARRWVR